MRCKQIVVLFITLITVFSFSACDQTATVRTVHYEAEEEYMSLEEAINESYCIVLASLTDIKESDDLREYVFNTEQVLQGDMSENMFYVSEGYGSIEVIGTDISYTTVSPTFAVGNKYVLVMSKYSSVYLDNDEYCNLCNICLQVDGNNDVVQSTMYQVNLNNGFNNLEDVVKYIDEVTLPSKVAKALGIPFIESDNLTEIAVNSQHIVRVRIGDISIPIKNGNRDTYYCDVIEELKGSTDSRIQAVLFKNTVVKGNEYILLLNKDTETSLIYTLSSRSSVVDIEDADKVEKIYSYIDQ